MKHFYNLNFNQKINSDLLKSFERTTEGWNLSYVPLELFKDTGIIDYFKEINFICNPLVALFIGPGHKVTPIHSDLSHSNKHAVYGLNYIWGSDHNSSHMSWYKVKENIQPKTSYTTSNEPFYCYFENEVNELETMYDNYHKLILLRVDTLHRVYNNSENTRYCLSFRGNPIKPWDEMVKYFQPFIQY